MNNSTSTSLDYVEALPLAAEQKAGLRDRLRGQGDDAPDAVHQALSDGPAPDGENLADEDVALRSVKSRLHMAWSQTARHPELLVNDSRGRKAIKAMPTIKRTTMFPEPWFTNPLVRFWGGGCAAGRARRAISRKWSPAKTVTGGLSAPSVAIFCWR